MADTARARLIALARRRLLEPPTLERVDASALPQPALHAARIVWARRVVNETLSVEVAARLRATALVAGLVPEAHAALERLEADEARHVALAQAVLTALGEDAPACSPSPPMREELAAVRLMRLVLTGLAVCETVSAARFAAVRRYTDLPVYREIIELFLRDETAHGELGFVLLEDVLAQLRVAVGSPAASAVVSDELRATLRHLDEVVGLDFARRGGVPALRPQPSGNPGVVEPAVDAVAFYEAIEQTILPRLEKLGVPARVAWDARWS